MTQNEKIVWAAVFARALAAERDRSPGASDQVLVVVAQVEATKTIVTMREVDPEFDKHIDAF